MRFWSEIREFLSYRFEREFNFDWKGCGLKIILSCINPYLNSSFKSQLLNFCIIEMIKIKKSKRLRLFGLKPPQTSSSKYNPIFGQFYQKYNIPGDKAVHKSIKYHGQRPNFKVQKYHPKLDKPASMVSLCKI